MYDSDKRNDAENILMASIIKKKNEFEEYVLKYNRMPKDLEKYEKYIKINKRTKTISLLDDVIEEEMKNEGFMVIISNDLTNVKDVFTTYRRKDVVEKSFDNMSALSPVGHNMIATILKAVISKKFDLFNEAPKLVKEFGQALKNNATQLGEAGKSWIATLQESINNSWLVMTLSKVPEWTKGLIDAFKTKYDDFKQIGQNIHDNIKTKFSELWDGSNGIKKTAKDGMTGLYDSFKNELNQFGVIGQTIVNLVKNNLKQKWEDWLRATIDVFFQWMKSLYLKFVDTINLFAEVGSDIVAGIKKGISDAWNTLKNDVTAKAKSLLADIKKVLGIASPSKEFAKQVGHWIPAGIAQGITRNMGVLNDAMDEMAGTVLSDAISDTKIIASGNYSIGSYSPSPMSSGYNQTINVYSPKSLSPAEVARQTRNNTRNMVLALRGV